jgi:hypothetical protein
MQNVRPIVNSFPDTKNMWMLGLGYIQRMSEIILPLSSVRTDPHRALLVLKSPRKTNTGGY